MCIFLASVSFCLLWSHFLSYPRSFQASPPHYCYPCQVVNAFCQQLNITFKKRCYGNTVTSSPHFQLSCQIWFKLMAQKKTENLPLAENIIYSISVRNQLLFTTLDQSLQFSLYLYLAASKTCHHWHLWQNQVCCALFDIVHFAF